jgi:hypothetical protein
MQSAGESGTTRTKVVVDEVLERKKKTSKGEKLEAQTTRTRLLLLGAAA